jgi:hypothetical protein
MIGRLAGETVAAGVGLGVGVGVGVGVGLGVLVGRGVGLGVGVPVVSRVNAAGIAAEAAAWRATAAFSALLPGTMGAPEPEQAASQLVARRAIIAAFFIAPIRSAR